MNNEILRLRMFAGPNGSGKSTFKSIIRPELLGIFINPDEIEQQIRRYEFLDLESYEVNTPRCQRHFLLCLLQKRQILYETQNHMHQLLLPIINFQTILFLQLHPQAKW